MPDTHAKIPLHNVPDNAFDQVKARSKACLAVYKDIRAIDPIKHARAMGRVRTGRTEAAKAFFYAFSVEEKENFDKYVKMGFFKQITVPGKQ